VSAHLTRIISGGQTGADRAALDFAIRHGIPHGGWCPHGRLAEDGAIDFRYRLRETPSAGYEQRTEWNVRDSDGTVIFSIAEQLVAGSKLTEELASRHGKPCLHMARGFASHPAQLLHQFIAGHRIQVLNVAGPRVSTEPDIAIFTGSVLRAWWKEHRSSQATGANLRVGH